MENGKKQKTSLKKKVMIAGAIALSAGLAYLVGKHGVKGGCKVVKDSASKAAGKVKSLLTSKPACEDSTCSETATQEQQAPRSNNNHYRHNNGHYWKYSKGTGGNNVTNNN